MCQLNSIKLKHRKAVSQLSLPAFAGDEYSNAKRCVNFVPSLFALAVAKKQQANRNPEIQCKTKHSAASCLCATMRFLWVPIDMRQPNYHSQSAVQAYASRRCASRKPSSQLGFTLVEMLVVLLIVGMVSGLLFDGAAQLMGMQARLERQLTKLRGEAMRADWLRQVVQGLQPDYADGKQIFKGSPRGFSGLTTNALSSGYSALQPFEVTLTHDKASNRMVLRYGNVSNTSALNTSVLLSWPGERGSLRYLDDRGGAHEQWPPSLGLSPQVPSGIALEAESDGAPWLIAAAHFGPTWPIQRPSDLIGVMR
jgi:prepilin-type N-terminal cleavage/methylation domain-containing protein